MMPSYQFSIYALLLIANGVFALSIAFLAYQRREVRTARLLQWMALAVGWWSITYGLHVASSDFASQYFFNRIKYLGAAFVAPLWFLLAYAYTQAPHDLSRRGRALVIASTVVFLPLVSFDPQWHTWWSRLWAERLDNGLLVMRSTHTVFYFLYVAVTFLWLLAGIVLYLRHYLDAPPHKRPQVVWMILAGLIPGVANIVTQLGFSPVPWGLDPFMFSFSLLFVALAILRHRFLETLPIAQQLIIEQLPQGVIVIDPGQLVVDINPVAADLCHTPPAEAVGRPLPQVIRDRILREQVLPELKAERSDEVEIDLPQRQQTLTMRIVPVRAADELLGKIITLTDITQRKKLESELAKARDMAVVANALKSRLLASTSQDMRHPIGMVMGYLESLLGGAYGPLSTEQQQVITLALQQANQMIGFLNNLIGYAEMESGAMMLQPEPFSPQALLDAVRPTIETLASVKELETHWEIDPDLPKQLHGDLTWLARVLGNLLNNAVTYTSHGHIRTRLYRADEGHWAMEVTDTGQGISRQDQMHLFDLQQANGLGLIVARGLVEQMGGELRFHSTPGQGSTFVAVFPLS